MFHGLLVMSLSLSHRAHASDMMFQSVPPELSLAVPGHQAASAASAGLTGAHMRHKRSCKPHSWTHDSWKSLQSVLPSLLLRIWVSVQPPYCASSPTISIPGNKMLSISWKITPWIQSLYKDGKACAEVSVVKEEVAILHAESQNVLLPVFLSIFWILVKDKLPYLRKKLSKVLV